MNRRLPATVLAIAGLSAVLALSNATAAFAATVTGTVGDYSYSANDNDVTAGATVTGYTGPLAATIPDTVTLGTPAQTYAVTAIGAHAFDAHYITSVTIPNSVTSIGDAAFISNHLTSVTLPTAITSIATYAFADNQLTSIAIPNGVTAIGDVAFANNSLTSVIIPDAVTTVGTLAFAANSLTSVTIGNSVTTIGDSAFANNNLGAVTIPASVTSIGTSVFGNNSGLYRVEFLGGPPTTFSASGSGNDSLGTSPDVNIYYNWAFDAAQSPGGFTTPTWQGYNSREETTVTFAMNGHGTAPATQTLAIGDPATQPTDPTAAGYTFTGWFSDAGLTTKADFTDPINANTIVYAGWKALVIPTLAFTGETGNPLALPLASALLMVGVALTLASRRKQAH
jgi:uncharacterized repeat protein (TIGR02543 family)